jgi:hypothetical protein
MWSATHHGRGQAGSVTEARRSSIGPGLSASSLLGHRETRGRDRHRVIVVSAAKTSGVRPGEQGATLLRRSFVNGHGNTSPLNHGAVPMIEPHADRRSLDWRGVRGAYDPNVLSGLATAQDART